ncbi:MAG: NifU family protein, partial [Acidobacteria bacterium]|nr:NifU family protein [Acidobacteriota bacterium]
GVGLVIRNPNAPASPAVDFGDDIELTGTTEEKVRQLLEQQINPAIAAHGGVATVVSVVGSTANLELGGGCQGCGMAAVTLRQGIETAVFSAIPEITGHYFFADYVSARIWSYRYDGAVLSDSTERTAALDPQVTGQTISNISSFGEDAYGELYITDLSGEVYKIVPDVVIDCDSNGVHDSCEIAFGVTPDADANGVPDPCESPCICACHANPICDAVHDIFDLVQIASVAFRSQPQSDDPDCPVAREDCNCDGDVNVFDAVHMVNVALKNMDPAGQFCDPCAP